MKLKNYIRSSIKKEYVIAFGIIAIAFILFSLSHSGISGNAIINLKTHYVKNSPLDGVLILSVHPGELIPASSKLIFKGTKNTKTFLLKEIIASPTTNGSFYVHGSSITGEGRGYGTEGQRATPAKITFSLLLSSNSTHKTSSVTHSTKQIHVPKKSSHNKTIIINKSTTNTTKPKSLKIGNTSIVNIPEKTKNITQKDSSKKPLKNNASSNPVTKVISISGDIIKNLISEGKNVLDTSSAINGNTSKESPFVYTLKNGESIRLKSGSVKIGKLSLPDDTIKISVIGKKVVVTTNYNISKTGFGKEFLREKQKDFTINLSKLNLTFQEGKLDVLVVYNNTKLFSLSTTLSPNVTINENQINSSNNTEVPVANLTIFFNHTLTAVQKNILLKTFDNSSVKVTKSELINGRLVIKYELGDYWVEYSYYPDSENIERRMQRDRTGWLINLANKLLEKSVVQKPTTLITKEYKIQ